MTTSTLTNDYTARAPLEAETYRILGEYMANDMNWSSTAATIANVYRAMWSSALPAARVTEIANAMTGWTFPPELIQTTLTAMVRAKVLRTRMQAGVRFYEVNYH